MEIFYSVPYLLLECPNLKLKRPLWFERPSSMTVFSLVLFGYFLITAGIIYDVIVAPPSLGSMLDEQGNPRLMAFLKYRLNGQYIMEGLAASFLYSLGGIGIVMTDHANQASVPRHNRIFLLLIAFISILISFFMCRVFMKIKLPYYLGE